MAFATLVMSELLRAFTARSELRSVFEMGLFANRWMVWAVLSSALLLLAALYVPFLQTFFGTVPLGGQDWLTILPFMFAAPATAEVTKLVLRRLNGRQARQAALP
jgi:Ca2+-transporting ATPase